MSSATRLLVITGASGSGKTAIVSALSSRPGSNIRYHHFDSVGVPTPEEMERDYGSGEGWQTAVTNQWIARLSQDQAEVALHVLEGQVRPAVVQKAFEANQMYQSQMLLLDCSPEVRTARLHGPRGQPELATAQMMAWSAYLRGQADALGIPVLDTSTLTLESATSAVERHVQSVLGEDKGNGQLDLEIRDLPPADFHLMWPIFHAVVSAGDTYSLDPNTSFDAASLLWTTPPSRAFLALKDGVVVGGYVLRPARDGLGDHVANAGYMVAPEARGQGIARKLCEHSLEVARQAGYQAMQFHYVVASNEAAVRVWQRCGFAIVGRAPQTFRHPRLGLVDTLIMHRYL